MLGMMAVILTALGRVMVFPADGVGGDNGGDGEMVTALN